MYFFFYIGDVTEDMTMSVETPEGEKSKTPIQRVDFTSPSNQKNVTLKVSNLKEKPSEINDFRGFVVAGVGLSNRPK